MKMNPALVYSLYTIVFFALIYYLLAHSEVEEHFVGLGKTSTVLDVIYFSTSIQGTVGFGDVQPKSYTARFVVSVQQLFVIVGLSRLRDITVY
ncbi:hypothetical protein [Dishui Lake phycodnavirus 4]|jgi:hypothetical protein|nr:hypothetical protein [Dishui Lake phycodnavirus 4]